MRVLRVLDILRVLAVSCRYTKSRNAPEATRGCDDAGCERVATTQGCHNARCDVGCSNAAEKPLTGATQRDPTPSNHIQYI